VAILKNRTAMQEDYLKSKLIENSTSLLTDFFNVISDGYNPALISVTIDLTKNIKNEEIFIYKTINWIGTKEYCEGSILPTKTNINFIKKRINENFQWCLEHVVGFSQVPKLFESEYHYNNLKNLVKKVEGQIIMFLENWNPNGTEYLIDTGDGSLERVLVIHSQNKTIVIKFGNYIH
jgi:hypothetical protein